VSAEAIHPPGVREVQSTKGKLAKLQPRRHGPHPIIKVISDVNYEVDLPSTIGANRVFHVSMLTPFKAGERYQPPPPPLWSDQQGDIWEVEACLGRRTRMYNNTPVVQYLIHWKGFPHSENTWEPQQSVKKVGVVKQYDIDHPFEPPKPRKTRGQRGQKKR